MGEHPRRRGKPFPFEHGGPVYGVSGQDVLSDEMGAVGPERREPVIVCCISGRGDVVDEGVEPDVGDIIGIERDLDPPAQAAFGTADAEVLQGLSEKSQHLVTARLRSDEIRVILDVLDEPALIFTHFKKVVALFYLNHFPTAIRTVAFGQVLFGPETLIGNAVPARIGALVDIPAVEELLKEMLYHLYVAFLGGADEIVIGDVKAPPEVLETDHHLVAVLLGCFPPLPGGLFHFLAVLVRAGEEHDLPSGHPHVAGNHVSCDGSINVPDVGDVIDIIDGCRHIECVFAHFNFSRNSSMSITSGLSSVMSMVTVCLNISTDLILPVPSGRVTFLPIFGTPRDASLYWSYS